ncbi:MAG: right-handed parallel beta-helix repeat-containing protein [Solirubrobacterales bacterium]|nr:right-handed parallel beta-helix repeat-containing protein [Solirubrobacterales bacterium]
MPLLVRTPRVPHAPARRRALAAAAAVLGLALTAPGAADAATLHVAPAGCDDTRTAAVATSPSTPLCSIPRAWALAAPGDVVAVHDGSYPAASLTGGTSRTAPVTIAAAPGALPRIAGLRLAGTSKVVLDHLDLSGLLDVDLGTSSVTVRASNLRNGMALEEGVRDVLVESSWITSPTSMGIHWSTDASRPAIEDVTIRRTRFQDVGVVAINARNFRNVVIEDNEFVGTHSWDGIRHTDVIRTYAGGRGLFVRRNFIHDNAAQGFFIKDGKVSDAVLEDNVIVRTDKHYAVNVYNVDGIRVANNTIADNYGSVAFNGTATNAEFVNNISHSLLVPGTVSWLREDYNVLPGRGGTGPNEIRATPLFVDPAARDYRLAATSPGVGTGLAAELSPIDIQRVARTGVAGLLDGRPVTGLGAYGTAGTSGAPPWPAPGVVVPQEPVGPAPAFDGLTLDAPSLTWSSSSVYVRARCSLACIVRATNVTPGVTQTARTATLAAGAEGTLRIPVDRRELRAIAGGASTVTLTIAVAASTADGKRASRTLSLPVAL